MEDFVGPQAEHVAIGGGHAVQAPVGGGLLDPLVQLLAVLAHAGHQFAGEGGQVLGLEPWLIRASPTAGELCGFRSS